VTVEIIPYRPELTPQLLQLQTNLWGADIGLNAAYFKWKYLESPYAGEPLIHLARSEGRIVGMRGMFTTLWEAGGGGPQLLPYADDLVVDPEFRNRGVVRRLMEANFEEGAARGFPFCLSLSAGQVTYLSSLAAGWRTVGDFQPVGNFRALPLQVERARVFLDQHVSHRAALLLGRAVKRPAFARLDRVAPASPGPGSPIVLGHEARPEAMADLVARLPWDGRIRHVRDAAYFGWRFRNPLRQYRFLFWVETGGGLRGYLVLHHRLGESSGLQRVNLVDWEGTDDQVRAGLLDAVLRWGRIPRLETWTAGVPESARAHLRDLGFERLSPQSQGRWGHHLLVRRLGHGPMTPWGFGNRDLLNMEDWDLRMLYSMAG